MAVLELSISFISGIGEGVVYSWMFSVSKISGSFVFSMGSLYKELFFDAKTSESFFCMPPEKAIIIVPEITHTNRTPKAVLLVKKFATFNFFFLGVKFNIPLNFIPGPFANF